MVYIQFDVETPAQTMVQNSNLDYEKYLCKHNIIFHKISNHRYKCDDTEIWNNAC